MIHGTIALSAVALSFYVLTSGFATTAQTKEPVYGQQLMTSQDMHRYRQKMRDAPGDEERQRIRIEHYQEMRERAKNRGIVLPAMARSMGRGMSAGQGTGSGQSGSGR
jgi:hypothetical protein